MGAGGSCREQATCPSHVPSCAAETVWISSQLRLLEAHYAFRSSSRSLPAVLLRALPRHNRKNTPPLPVLSSLRATRLCLAGRPLQNLGAWPLLEGGVDTHLYHTSLQQGAVVELEGDRLPHKSCCLS